MEQITKSTLNSRPLARNSVVSQLDPANSASVGANPGQSENRSPSLASKKDAADFYSHLMEAIANERDRSSFMILFDHFAPRIKCYLMSLGAESGSAEELAQEVMITAWQKADKYDRSKASVSTWLFTIARNRRIDVIRKERRGANLSIELEFDRPEVEWPDSILDSEQRDAIVRTAVAKLPEKQQQVLQKAFFEGKSHNEISEELSVALGTVKSRIRLAYDRLRLSLEIEVLP